MLEALDLILKTIQNCKAIPPIFGLHFANYFEKHYQLKSLKNLSNTAVSGSLIYKKKKKL